MKMTKGQAEEIKSSSAWRYLVEEIEYRIDCSLKELRSCPPERLMEVQKRIQGLDEILQLPDSVIDREESTTTGRP